MSDHQISEQDRLNQLLCAYVLGEADAAERAEIEGALARDPALREERDRIAATVGLVKDAMGKDETLSYRATSEVTRAAAEMIAGPVPARRPVAWYQSSSLRAAASIVALVGGSFLGWRAYVSSQAVESGVFTASAPPASEAAPVAADSRLALGYTGGRGDQAKLKGLGYLSSNPTAPAGRPNAEQDKGLYKGPGDSVPEKKRVELVQAQLRKASEDSLALRSSGLKDVNATDGANAPSDSAGLFVGKGQVAPAADSKLVEVALAEEAGEFNPDPDSLRELYVATAQAGLPEPTGQAAGQSGSDEFYLGKGEKNELAAGVPGGTPIGTGAVNHNNSPPPFASRRLRGGGGGTPGPAGPGVPRSAGSGAALPERGLPAGLAAASPAAGESKLALLLDGSSDGDHKARTDNNFDFESEAGDIFELGTEVSLEAQTDFERVDRFKEGKVNELSDDASRRQRRNWTPEERQARVEQIIASCRRLPNERPRDMFFRFWGDNPFEWTANDRQSTFSMDVDTASYTLARKYLVENQLPEKAQIRTEEFLNYFKPDIAPPTKGTFTIATELAPSRFSNPAENKWMLRVAIRGKEIQKNERDPLALTLVVDVSGSMKEQNRLELVKHAMRQLVSQLDARDSISIVAFSSDSRLMLPMTSAAKRDLIESAINPLQPDRGTNTEAGLRMGYEQALAAISKNTINRVVLLTDGVANEGITDPNVISQGVERQRKAGIYLNTIGVGMNNHNDNLLEQLADKGDGVCNYVDDAAEVKHVLVDNLLQTLVPIARDAKIQVEFDPAQVESYRLLGYENRAIADKDFRNDKVDAGEINSGHQITALYEIVRVGNLANQDAPLAKVNVRFKPPHKDGVASPGGEEASEISSPVYGKSASAGFEATTYGYRRAVLAAQFAEFLRRSVHARGDSLDQLISDAQKLASEKNDQETAEFSDMVVKSKALLDQELSNYGELQQRLDRLRHISWEKARLESMQREIDRARLAQMDTEIASLENSLREELDRRRVK